MATNVREVSYTTRVLHERYAQQDAGAWLQDAGNRILVHTGLVPDTYVARGAADIEAAFRRNGDEYHARGDAQAADAEIAEGYRKQAEYLGEHGVSRRVGYEVLRAYTHDAYGVARSLADAIARGDANPLPEEDDYMVSERWTA